MRSNDFFRHGFLVLAATLILNAGAFLFHAVVSRSLGVAGYGSLYAVISLALLAAFPANIFNTVISKIAAEFAALDDPTHLRALVLVGCKAFSFGLLIYFALGLLLAVPIGTFMHVPNWEVVLALSAAGCVNFVFALRAIAQGAQHFRAFSAALVMDGGLKSTLGAALAAGKFGITGGLAGFFAGTILSGAFTVWQLWAHFGTAARTTLRMDVRRLYSATAGATALTASIAILSYADVMVVKAFFSPHDAGIYAAASLGGKIMFFLVYFAPMVMIPKVVDSHSRRQNPLIALRGALAMVLALSTTGLLVFFLGGSLILRLLVGASFEQAAPLLSWYGLAMSLLAIANVIASYSIALHRFAFSLPLLFSALAEVAAIVLYHPNLHIVVMIVVLGNALAMIATSMSLLLQTVQSPREA